MKNSGNESSAAYLTREFEGIGGAIKTCNEDFFVEEVPLYSPSGEGTHVYAQIEKNGVTTMDAMVLIAKSLNIMRKGIGYAGLKDARAVTRQWISIEHIDPAKVMGVEIPGIKVIQTARHLNKLKLGHLSCNRFVVKLRDVRFPLKEAARKAEEMIAILGAKGVPNYFGEQRFGIRNETHRLGEAVAKGKTEDFMDIFLGRPTADEQPPFSTAREYYEKGEYEKAVRAWPYSYSNQRRALKVLIAKRGNKNKAYCVIDKYLKGFFVSAFQSDLFNQVLTARMPGIDRLYTGDMAYKHVNGACFRVEDAAVEQARCDAFEISPTGPMLGSHMTQLTGQAGEIENTLLREAGLEERDYEQMDKYGGRGGRRPLRFQPRNAKVGTGEDKLGGYVELQFELDSGCYATCFIREISKADL